MSLEEQREEVQRVLHSPQFRRAPKLQRLMELICEYHFQNRPQDISEFLIATEAFGKGPSFDPSQDSLVRVQAREARRRLHEYYRAEGKDSRVILDIPVGSYAPVFTLADRPVLRQPAPSPRVAWFILAATVLACAVLLFSADRERRQLLGASAAAAQSTAGPAGPSVLRLWNRFLESDVPTVLVLSNPDVGECGSGQKAVTPPAKSAGVTATKETGCPDEYTGMGEAVALHLITNLFQSKQKTLIVKQSRMVTEDDVKRYNLIMLGGKMVNVWTRRLGADLRLVTDANDLAPAHPSLDPAQRFETAFDSAGQLIRDRGIIALRRHSTTGHWLLFLYGKHTQGTHAAAEASTDERFLARLQWPSSIAPFPDRFCVLVGVTVNDGIPEGPVQVALRVP